MTDSASSKEVYELLIRVYIEDTDAGGIVFHGKYLSYMERARTEWVRDQGISLRDGLADNISYVVQRLSIHYTAAGMLDDELRVSAELTGSGRVWMGFLQKVRRKSDGVLLAEADVKVACVALDTGKPRRLPEAIIELLNNTHTNPNRLIGIDQE